MSKPLKNFIIATPVLSLPITGEQAAILYEQLGEHIGRGKSKKKKAKHK